MDEKKINSWKEYDEVMRYVTKSEPLPKECLEFLKEKNCITAEVYNVVVGEEE